ncbi:MAG: ATP-binding protein [Candidatus Omnitrophota bacterium]|nr:ATP-binding protein [Candidatus Omnitrophota bacterium]
MTPFRFDRGDLLSLLRKRVSGFQAGYRQNLALIGPPGVGKSALIRQFLSEEVRGESLLLPLYFEVGAEESAPEWVSRFARTVLYAVLQLRETESFPTDLAGLVKTCAALVPRTAALAKRITALSESGRLDEAYDHLWELPHLLTQETGHRVLLALDEFHRLRGFSVKEPFRSLGRNIMVQPTTLYLLASSEPAAAQAILGEGLALLFGKFESVEVPPLASRACRNAIRQARPEEAVDPFDEYLLMDLAQGQPHRLNLLLGAWRGSLTDLLESLFIDPGSPLRHEFEQRLRLLPSLRNRIFCLQVLERVAIGGCRQEPSAQVAGALRLLKDCGLIAREGAFYRVPDRLFRLWLITAQPVLQGVGLIGESQASGHFRRAAAAWMEQLRRAVDRPREEQLRELMLLWNGEVLELDGKKALLPKFRQVEQVPGPLDRPSLLGRPAKSQKGGWWVVPWKGPLDEVLARQVVHQVRAFAPLKEYRKVLIGASPAEVNARLVLQEAKVRFWDLGVLNRLLDLYGFSPLPVPEEADHSPALTVPLPEVPPVSTRLEAAGNERGQVL